MGEYCVTRFGCPGYYWGTYQSEQDEVVAMELKRQQLTQVVFEYSNDYSLDIQKLFFIGRDVLSGLVRTYSSLSGRYNNARSIRRGYDGHPAWNKVNYSIFGNSIKTLIGIMNELW